MLVVFESMLRWYRFFFMIIQNATVIWHTHTHTHTHPSVPEGGTYWIKIRSGIYNTTLLFLLSYKLNPGWWMWWCDVHPRFPVNKEVYFEYSTWCCSTNTALNSTAQVLYSIESKVKQIDTTFSTTDTDMILHYCTVSIQVQKVFILYFIQYSEYSIV